LFAGKCHEFSVNKVSILFVRAQIFIPGLYVEVYKDDAVLTALKWYKNC